MLILVPSPLSQTEPKLALLQADLPLVHRCTIWVVENSKPARASLGTLGMPVPIRDLQVLEQEKVSPSERVRLLKDSSEENPIGLLSDAGCPGIADPGSEWVAEAHKLGVKVMPLVGPSSILLSLMASGLNGQKFQFHGYPPVQPTERDLWIVESERASKLQGCTQLVIETPFRNGKLMEALLAKLNDKTRLCVARDLTGPNQWIACKPVSQWKAKQVPELGKHPTLFLWLA